MNDGIAAGKRRERLRPQQAMGIGNRANGSHHARPDYKRSRAASSVMNSRRRMSGMGTLHSQLATVKPVSPWANLNCPELNISPDYGSKCEEFALSRSCPPYPR